MTKSLQNSQPRIPAQRWWLGDLAVYYGLVRPALRRAFHRVLLDDQSVRSDTGQRLMRSASPLLCYVTHTAWWDGYLALELFRTVYPRTGFLMMEEAQLRRYFFFRWEGCFSVDRADPREGLRAIRYAASLLQTEHKPIVWLFPQGAIQPSDQRPLTLYRGAAEIAMRTDGVWCLPIALRYEFGQEQRPEALISFGQPDWVDRSWARSAVQSLFEQRLTAAADNLRAAWLSQDLAAFRTVLRGRSSTNRVFDALLGPLVRRFFPNPQSPSNG